MVHRQALALCLSAFITVQTCRVVVVDGVPTARATDHWFTLRKDAITGFEEETFPGVPCLQIIIPQGTRYIVGTPEQMHDWLEPATRAGR